MQCCNYPLTELPGFFENLWLLLVSLANRKLQSCPGGWALPAGRPVRLLPLPNLRYTSTTGSLLPDVLELPSDTPLDHQTNAECMDTVEIVVPDIGSNVKKEIIVG